MPFAPHAWVAEPPEAEVVARLMVEFRDSYGRDWPSDDAFLASVERLIADPDAELLLASPDDDAPAAGVAQVRYRHSIWTAADDCWLEDLYVREAARRRGVGEALARLVVERAQRRGCRRVELDVNERNEPALALYARLGFEVSRKPPGGRDVLMRLRLAE
jgi:ribosomal protein S18 acetylase RimI-like enzyme